MNTFTVTFLLINQVIALQHHPSVVPKEKDGRLQTDIVDIKTVCLAVPVLSLGESCFSSISFSPSLLLSPEVKMSH